MNALSDRPHFQVAGHIKLGWKMAMLDYLVRQRHWYKQLRYTRAYDLYSRIAGTAHASSLAADRAFYRALFEGKVTSVFDIGANVGEKSRVFAELATDVISVEPDPDLADTLRYRFKRQRKIVVESVAMGQSPGTASLHRKQLAGFNTLSEKWSQRAAELDVKSRDVIQVSVTTLDRLIAKYRRPDYIKIDVEGYELPVLLGLSVAVPMLSFESNLPVFCDETVEILQRIENLDHAYRFNARPVDATTFVLPTHLGADDMRRFVKSAGAVTYDLFAIR